MAAALLRTPNASYETNPMNGNDTARRPRNGAPKPKRLSRLHAPSDMAPEAWQVALRRQYGREQKFNLENLGREPVFSEFRITNSVTGGRYRVAIRGAGLGENYCSCPDYATNELGTCKHIEFALAALERKRGGRAALKRGYQVPFSEVYLRYGAQRSVHFRPGTGCPRPLLAAAQKLFDQGAGWRLAPDRFSHLEDFLARTIDGHELRVYDDALEFIAHARDAERRRKLVDTVFSNGARSRRLRQLLKVPLYPYQAEGALFAARAGRCLIGDEMGLGKTVQAVAAAEILTRHLGVERVLVICPASLKHQWELELLRFTGRASRVIGGGRARRQQQYADSEAWKIAAYDTVARDLDLVTSWSPDLVIVDEAQRIKNWNTIAARALKRIDTPYAFVLTGTPLENKLEELVSIVQFVDRHRLGPTWRLLHEHQLRDEHGRVIGYQRLDDIAHTLAPIMIRRRKKEVLSQLPERVDHNRFVPMTAEQLRFHEENREIVARIVARWRKTRFLSEADQRRLTCALQNMRMSCNSTYLLDHETDYGVKTDELIALLEDLFEEPDAKAVVFSQWLGTHELIAQRLAVRRWGHVLFHGGVPSDQRGSLVQRFREDPQCRVFLSTDAGGLGLNLQHAATVINMDLPWNPAVLEQRIGRVHRLGQRRGVQVVNLIARGTIEEGMLSLLGFKKSLFAGVLDGGNPEVFLHGTRLSRFMEGVEKATTTTGQPEIHVPAPEPPLAEEIAAAADTEQEASAPALELAAAAGGHESGAAATDPWQTLLDAGLKFIEHLSQASGGVGRGSGEAATAYSWLETDASTGRSYLRLPLPAPEALRRLTSTLESLLSGLSKS